MDLNRDIFEPPPPAGWKKPLPAHLSRPTYWPAILALSDDPRVVGASDTNTNHGRWAGSGNVALVGWIGDILHE